MIKQKKESNLSLFILTIIIIIITVFLAFSNIKIVQKKKELLAQIDRLKKEIALLENENQKMLKEDWEEKLREQGYKKPGETEVIIKKEPPPQEEEKVEKTNFWSEFLAQIKEFLK